LTEGFCRSSNRLRRISTKEEDQDAEEGKEGVWEAGGPGRRRAG